MRHGKTFVANSQNYPKLLRVFPGLQSTIEPKPDEVYKSYSRTKGGWMPFVDIYQPFLDQLRSVFLMSPSNYSGKMYDVVIHLRLDDIIGSGDNYSILPLAFYKDALTKIQNKRTVLLVYRQPEDKDKTLHLILRETRNAIMQVPGVEIVDAQTGTEQEDFNALCFAAPVALLSISTFSFWASFLSTTIREVHLPYWGIYTDSVWGAMRTKKWTSTESKKIIFYTMPKGFKSIRTQGDWDKYARLGYDGPLE